MNCGIYEIRNTATGQRYIGRAVHIPRRISKHLTELRGGRHYNLHMQRSFVKYGEGRFSARALIICRPEDLAIYEHLLIKGFRSDNGALGFNKTVATDHGILTHTDDAKARIAHYNRTAKPKYERTPEIRGRISIALTGRPSPKKGKPMSAEQRAKLSDAKKRNWADPEYRAQMTAKIHAPGCRRLSAEVREKTAATLRARPKKERPPNVRVPRESMSTERRAAVAANIKALWANPEYRAMMKKARGADIGFKIWDSRRRNRPGKVGD